MLYQVWGIPFQAHGNAKDWEYNIPNGFTKLSANTELKRGDILVYGSNYGGGYGHIGFIDANWKYFDQNGIKPLKISYKDTPFPGYRCVLRYKGTVDCGDTEDFTTGVYKTLAVMKVRDGVWGRQKTYSELSEDGKKHALSNGCYKEGTEFTALEIINHSDGSVWARGYSGYVCIKDNTNTYCVKV